MVVFNFLFVFVFGCFIGDLILVAELLLRRFRLSDLLKANILDLRNAGALQEIKFVISASQTNTQDIVAQVTLATPLT